ncbi:hypothetical protein Cni_G17716 [Canna indica]|uniref:Uncharacterized protein n=1 Tax=Canna indica TaxID=4628 RepID=A0AAQ3KL03_9LILI|nr:hypothetical protein Cni_G17716 [Canna indica]
MGRTPCCDKAKVKKGSWSAEEDAKLKSYIEQHGTASNWIALPRKIGLRRCGKSCRLRWLNYLRPDIKHGEFSEEEDNIICRLYLTIGTRWSVMAAQLPGRTDNDIKNHWNTRLKKKLLGKQQMKDRRPRPAACRAAEAKRDVKREETTGNLAKRDVCSSSLISPSAWLPASSYGELDSENSINGLFSTELDEIFRFESVKLEGTRTPLESVDWSEMSPFRYSNLVQGSEGILEQHQFAELPHHEQYLNKYCLI